MPKKQINVKGHKRKMGNKIVNVKQHKRKIDSRTRRLPKKLEAEMKMKTILNQIGHPAIEDANDIANNRSDIFTSKDEVQSLIDVMTYEGYLTENNKITQKGYKLIGY